MRPLFTIHAGEFLVGSRIEKLFKQDHVWVPARDTGVDLLVTDRKNRHAVSIQVRFSRDYHGFGSAAAFRKRFRTCSWLNINPAKLEHSRANLWVLVVYGFTGEVVDFVIVPTGVFRTRLKALHGTPKVVRAYLWTTTQGECWETRDLRSADLRRIADGDFPKGPRYFTSYLNNWAPLERLNGPKPR